MHTFVTSHTAARQQQLNQSEQSQPMERQKHSNFSMNMSLSTITTQRGQWKMVVIVVQSQCLNKKTKIFKNANNNFTTKLNL